MSDSTVPPPAAAARRRACLVILDGWGLREPTWDNAVTCAHTPTWDELWGSERYPRATVLRTARAR